jgi:hypothetical protein
MMGDLLSFDSFVAEARSHLWAMEIEPAFQTQLDIARFMWPPYSAELQPLDATHVRLAMSVSGKLARTVEYQMDSASARLVADGIMALFEPEEDRP